MDTVIRAALLELKHETEFGIEIEYRISQESSTREMRYQAPLNGKTKVRVILYADDLVIFCTSHSCLQRVIDKFESTFKRFGLCVARDKTETVDFDSPAQATSIVHLGEEPIKNVASFRYLGHVMSSDSKSDKIGHKIGSAWQSWNALKHVFLDREIPLRIRVSILESTVRARLTYALQARLLTLRENQRIESIWTGYLRKMVKGGYARKNAPPRGSKPSQLQDETIWDWSFKLTNKKLLEIAKTSSITAYIEKQHLKYIAHTTRRQNDQLQKILCFAVPRRGQQSHWTRLGKATDLDPMQLRKLMFQRSDFMNWLDLRYRHETPNTSRRVRGKQ